MKSADDIFENLVAKNYMKRVKPSSAFSLRPRDISGAECLKNISDDQETPADTSQSSTSTPYFSSPVKSESGRCVNEASLDTQDDPELGFEGESSVHSDTDTEPEISGLLEISRGEEMFTGSVETIVQSEEPVAPQIVKSRLWSEIVLEEEQITEVSSVVFSFRNQNPLLQPLSSFSQPK